MRKGECDIAKGSNEQSQVCRPALVDVTMIMKLLGHNDIKTTLRYLHVTNRDMLQVVSPLDNLNLE